MVWNSPIIQDYLADYPVSGYIGGFGRTVHKDRIVESELRKLHYNTSRIAKALISADGRYLDDALHGPQGKDDDYIRAQTARIIGHYVNVEIPIHTSGDSSGTITLRIR